MSIGRLNSIVVSGLLCNCLCTNFFRNLKSELELCESDIEGEVQMILGVYIHSFNEVACYHLFDCHVTFVEHLASSEYLAILFFDCLDSLFALSQLLGQSCYSFTGFYHFGSFIVYHLR